MHMLIYGWLYAQDLITCTFEDMFHFAADHRFHQILHRNVPGHLAQSGVSLTVNQGLAGLSPGPATFFR